MLIMGAGGLAKEILEILLQLNYKNEIFFFDDINPSKIQLYEKYAVLKSFDVVASLFKKNNSFCLGIGNVKEREKLFNKCIALQGEPATILSPYAKLGKNAVNIGRGSSIATGTVITTHVNIGTGCLVNLNCTIGHDTIVGNFCEISPGVHISGNCAIGNFCSIGTGAVILPGIILEDNVIVGAGSVVTKNVKENMIITGVPAKPFNKE